MFRHDDHKFEWTRSEFEDFCNHICQRFPEYLVQFHGVGDPPEGYENLGSCSQMGFFIRKDFFETLDQLQEDEVNEENDTKPLIECEDYKLVHSVEYPFFYDKRSFNEKLSDEIDYQLNRLSWLEEEYLNYETNRIEIPFNLLFNLCWQLTEDKEEVRKTVLRKFPIENDLIILPPNKQSSEEEFE